MKRKSVLPFFLLGLTLLGRGSVQGTTIGTIKSGVDLTKSSVQVAYDAEEPFTHQYFYCFGETALIDVDSLGPTYGEASVTKFLDDMEVQAFFNVGNTNRYFFGDQSDGEEAIVNIDLPSNFPNSMNCFHQSGDYTVSITLSDSLGNTKAQNTTFTVYATTPDEDETQNRLDDCSGKYANNDDECTAAIILYDVYGNLVNQLDGEDVSIYDNPTGWVFPFGDDANLGTPYEEAVKIFMPASGMFEYVFGLDSLNSADIEVVAGAEVPMRFTSIAPSIITKTGERWWEAFTVFTSLNVSTPTINIDGSVNTGILETLVESRRMLFWPPVEVNPEIVPGDANYSGGWSFTPCMYGTSCPEWNIGQEVFVKFLQNLVTPITGLVGDITGSILRFTHDDDYGNNVLYTVQYQNLEQSGSGGGITYDYNNAFNSDTYNQEFTIQGGFGGPLSVNGEPSANKSYVASDPMIQGTYDPNNNGANPDYNFGYYWNFLPPPNGLWLKKGADDALEIKTVVSYEVDGKVVSYGAGMYSLSAETNPLDISVEGFVIGDSQKVALVDDLIKIGSIRSTDVRESVSRNGFRLARGAPSQLNSGTTRTTFQGLDFVNNNVVVIKNATVEIETPSGMVWAGMPPAEPILSLPTGKKTLVIVDGNLEIGVNLAYANSSDSFGVIMINTSPAEHPTTGNIFVNENVMDLVGTYYADGGLMTVPDMSNPTVADAISTSQKQLRLTGALLTRNTIGGGQADGNGIYITPWRETNNGDANASQLAARYDLRKLRMYSANFNDINFVPGSLVDKEVAHPFILRLDRKAAEFPPPGFEAEQNLN